MTEVHEAVRRWAKGPYSLEAGVELLIRDCDGRFADSGQSWVQQRDNPGRWWIDVDQMIEGNFNALSGGEVRLLRVAASLLDGPPVDLSRNLASLDREHCQLVLAAIAHASGSHEQRGWPTTNQDGSCDVRGGMAIGPVRVAALRPWPDRRTQLEAGE